MNNDILAGFDDDTNDFLAIELRQKQGVDDCLTFKLVGQIDTYSSLFFQRRARKAIDAGFSNLIFLFGGVEYVSSMGVAALLQLQKAAREKGGISCLSTSRQESVRSSGSCAWKNSSGARNPRRKPSPRGGSAGRLRFSPGRSTVCEKRLRLVKSGRFRCPECKTILVIDESGSASTD